MANVVKLNGEWKGVFDRLYCCLLPKDMELGMNRLWVFDLQVFKLWILVRRFAASSDRTLSLLIVI